MNFFSFIWRSCLIFYAHGFVKDGKINLGLFTQLFWVLTVSIIMIALGMFPISALSRGDFLETSSGAKICLLKPMKEERGSQNILKQNVMCLVVLFDQLVFTLYSNKRVSTLRKRLCPDGKMSCIGKYRRNVIDYREARTFSLYTNFIVIVDVILVMVYDNFDVDPKIVFYIDSMVMVILSETVFFCIVSKLSMETIPEEIEAVQVAQFYSRPPGVPIPRRQYDPAASLPSSSQPNERFSLHGVKVIQHRTRTYHRMNNVQYTVYY